MLDYPVIVFFSPQDACYIADVPDLEICSAFGDTPEAAVREVQIALGLWLESAQEGGVPLPQPRYLPAYLAERFGSARAAAILQESPHDQP